MTQVAPGSVRQELLEATDEVIADAVGYADPMVLRGLLYQLTGDDEVAATGLQRLRVGFFEISMLATEEDVALLRRKAAEFLVAYRDGGAGRVDVVPQRLQRAMWLALGQEVPDEQTELWMSELALDPWARGLKWHKTPPAKRLEQFSVTVIGAGMGGLNAAVQLQEAGIAFAVVEKNSGVGGTWYENRYPGARVDTPSRTYSHLFGADFPFSSAFCTWTENQKYFDWVADNFQLRDRIVFDTEVRSLVWDEDSCTWEIIAEGPAGQRVWHSNAIITSVGFLNRPKLPDIEGMDDFTGQSWHSSRWPEEVDLAGKRVAVIGTGCSGYQIIPELAPEVEHLAVFQRSAQWLFDIPGYTSALPPRGQLAGAQPAHVHQLHAAHIAVRTGLGRRQVWGDRS